MFDNSHRITCIIGVACNRHVARFSRILVRLFWRVILRSSSGVSMQNGAHGKVEMCAVFYNLNIRYRRNFYKR